MSDPGAFEVWVKIGDWEGPRETANAPSAGKAKYLRWLDIRDTWADLPITAMRSRRVGPPSTSRMLEHVAEIRGLTGLRAGARVFMSNGARGAIVDASTGANLEVQFDADSPIYAGERAPVHHSDLTFEEAGDER
jgi:hypothetical protein